MKPLLILLIEVWKRIKFNLICCFYVDNYPVDKWLMGSIWPWGGWWIDRTTGKITRRYYENHNP